MIKVPGASFDRFIDVICYAASLDKVGSAGINRQEVGNARVLQERPREPS